jgi:hypothetical protein
MIFSSCYAKLTSTVKQIKITQGSNSPWVILFVSPEGVSNTFYSKETISKIFSIPINKILCIQCYENPEAIQFHDPFTIHKAHKIFNFLKNGFFSDSGEQLIIVCPIGHISASVAFGLARHKMCQYLIPPNKQNIKRIVNLIDDVYAGQTTYNHKKQVY